MAMSSPRLTRYLTSSLGHVDVNAIAPVCILSTCMGRRYASTKSKGPQNRIFRPKRSTIPVDFFTANKYKAEDGDLSTVSEGATAGATKRAKKRRVKDPVKDPEKYIPTTYECRAFCTAENYDILALRKILGREYTIEPLPAEIDPKNALCVSLPRSGCEKIDEDDIELAWRARVFLFRRGSTVTFNVNPAELERIQILRSRAQTLPLAVATEEFVPYGYANRKTKLKGSDVLFDENLDFATHLQEQYAIADALALSVKLDVWEDQQDEYMENMRSISRAMKLGKGLIVGMKQMLRTTGELQSLRHDINLSSSLRTPADVYWDRPEMELLYLRMRSQLDIHDRTSVLNEKLTYSNELAEILRGYVAQKHALHTELAIIGLIMVEVVFEAFHWVDRFGYLPGA